jgi:hypothetical protein
LAVKRDVLIDFDLETTPLEIKTDSSTGIRQEVHLNLYTSRDNYTGEVHIKYSSPHQYWLSGCITFWTNFLTRPTSATVKVWRITITRTPGTRIEIHCNEVEVLNLLMSNSTCSYSDWSTYWSRKIAKIKFDPTANTALINQYRPATGTLTNFFSYILNGTNQFVHF